jgi:hypothetical protein
MDPISAVVAAVALGASDGVREASKKLVSDAYRALRSLIGRRYSSVTAEVEGLEGEPEEELRRALLTKKLSQAGAGDDQELADLAQSVLAAVNDQAPDLPPSVGIVLRRTHVGGDIEVDDVTVTGGSGVFTEDVQAAGSLRINGVAVQGPQEPPHRSTEADDPTASVQSWASTQHNVNAGRDVITHVSSGDSRTGNSGGRIRAVTATVESVPFGTDLWTVTVDNQSSGPITDLTVKVYAVDKAGSRSTIQCLPAKGQVSLRSLFHEVFTAGLGGTLDAIGPQVTSMYPEAGTAFGNRFNSLGDYAPMVSAQLMNSPEMSQAIQQTQQQMLDKFPQVIGTRQATGVVYVAEGAAEVRADIQFADESGVRWQRRHGESAQLADGNAPT